MKFVIDTGCFRQMEDYYPDVFKTFWAQFQEAVDDSEIFSVREVWLEMEQQNKVNHVTEWAKLNKAHMFRTPVPEELAIVGQVLAVPHFSQLIGRKQLNKGSPVADPFLIAAGKHFGATVVTTEKFAPNSAKIPNVCQHFGVESTNLQGLLKAKGWSF